MVTKLRRLNEGIPHPLFDLRTCVSGLRRSLLGAAGLTDGDIYGKYGFRFPNFGADGFDRCRPIRLPRIPRPCGDSIDRRRTPATVQRPVLRLHYITGDVIVLRYNTGIRWRLSSEKQLQMIDSIRDIMLETLGALSFVKPADAALRYHPR